MATMVGHDLRNPLQVIISMVYLAKEMLISAETPPVEVGLSVAEILDDIEKSCSYMNQIISDLQSYAGPLNLVESLNYFAPSLSPYGLNYSYIFHNPNNL